MDKKDQFDLWVAQWAKAEKEIAAEEKALMNQRPEPIKPKASYFTGLPASADYYDNELPDEDWGAISDRVEVLSEELAPNGFNKKFPPNPTAVSSAGSDQEDEEGHTPVTDNWSDGEDLRMIDELKRNIEKMERKVHESDVLKKKDGPKLVKELKELKKRVTQLSEKITPSLKDNFN